MTNQNEEEKFVAEVLRIIEVTADDVATLFKEAGKKAVDENRMISESALNYAIYYNIFSLTTFVNAKILKIKTEQSKQECAKLACDSTITLVKTALNDVLDDFMKDLNV